MREYFKTHPWLKFQLDLRRPLPSLWLILGEVQSKCEHIANTPLSPAIASQLHCLYLAKGIQATTAIEGNTLSEEQVIQHIENKLELPPSQQYLGQEVDNILKACNRIKEDVFAGNAATVTVDQICNYNKLVLEGLEVGEDVVPGKFRKSSVGVGRYRAVPFEDCEYLLHELCKWIATDFDQISGYETAVWILKAIVAHVYFELIHPFGDGNGRTGRLIEFQLLLGGKVPTAAAHLLSNHYNQTRTEYYRQLDYISKSGGDIVPFIEYALKGFVDGLKGQLKWIQYQLFVVTWQNYVHELFGAKTSKADKRRRDLALAIGTATVSVPISKLTEISTRIASAYSGKTNKTLTRDIGILKKMQLIESTDKEVRAKPEVVYKFLPRRSE